VSFVVPFSEMSEPFPIALEVGPEAAGKRLDQFLTARLPNVSRARVQQLIAEGKVLVNGAVGKASLRLKCEQRIEILRSVQPPPLRATAEDIPLDVVYEDDQLAVVNKPAGMMVHAGAGATDDARNRGTLVNALLYRFGSLSEVGGQVRPGIVHRLDRGTSGLIVIAKTDQSHRALAEQFAGRKAKKTYIALAHGWLRQDQGTISVNISRDLLRRTRMTTRRQGGREAITHYKVRQRLDTPYGKFSLLEIKIDTGRTHQIRVHLASIGHPVVGDTLYGAPRELQLKPARPGRTRPPGKVLSLTRNFLHSAALEITHPATRERLSFSCPLPPELQQCMSLLEQKD
jgi:23S rRNA pseudouridine1911/1915/1917 synthase